MTSTVTSQPQTRIEGETTVTAMTADTSSATPQLGLYTIPEVMKLLRLSRSVVFELLRSKRLRSVKEGRSRRIPATAVAEYIALLEREAENE
jgi:excisionase family DNA binding protein